MVERLDVKISSPKKHSTPTVTTSHINLLDEHLVPITHDKKNIGNGTNAAPRHYDIVNFSMQPDNTSATASYLNNMLEGLEESIIDATSPSQSFIRILGDRSKSRGYSDK